MPTNISTLLTRGFRYAVALTGDEASAEDLVHDAWVSVLQANGPRNAPYLFRTIRSRWIDQFRKGGHISLVELDPSLPTLDKGAARVEQRMTLSPLLSLLRPEEREVLFLCAVEGYSASEAGELLNKPRNTVLSLLHRGRTRIRDAHPAQEAI